MADVPRAATGGSDPDPADAASRSPAALRRRAATPAATQADRADYADMLAALGFATRAADLRRRYGLPPGPAARLPAEPRPAVDPARVHIYLSARQRPLDEADRERLAGAIGTSDYSYGFAMAGFVEGLRQIGLPHSILANPEYVADIRDRSAAACNIHLGFYPPERLRLLKGAYNIACVAWEFDRLRLPSEVQSPHAFADQATMLNLPDAIWAPSAHGAAAISRSGVTKPVHAVPAPVFAHPRGGGRADGPQPARLDALAHGLGAIPWQPLAILPRLQALMNQTADRHRLSLADILAALGRDGPPAIFVTILNVHDSRKQIRPMLQGFAEFSQTHPDALLLVKSSTPARGLEPINSFLLRDQIFAAGERSRPLVSDRIWITDAVFTRDEMNLLYDIATYYLCTSHAEGQNLPLLEAMGRGLVPVSVDHTAMADYIRPDNAIPIRSVRRPFDMRLSRRYGMFGLETYFVEPADVRAALAEAIELAPAGYAARSAAALDTVRTHYGPVRLLAALRPLIATLRDTIEAGHG